MQFPEEFEGYGFEMESLTEQEFKIGVPQYSARKGGKRIKRGNNHSVQA